MKTKLKVIAAAVLATATLGTATVGAGAANAAPTSGDPVATGCASSARTVWTNTYLGAGTVEIRYSEACGTNWVRVSGATNRPSEAGIWSARSGWKWSPSYGWSPSQYWTPMVHAPGSDCVTFQVKITGANGLQVATGLKTLC